MFLMVFGKIANIPTDGVNTVLFYMAGITIWNYFSSCLTTTSSTFVANAGILENISPKTGNSALQCLVEHGEIRDPVLLLLAMMIFYSFKGFPIHFGLTWLWIPVLMIMMAGLGLRLGIIISSLTTKYRDLTVLISFAVQLLMYCHAELYILCPF